MEKNIKHLNFIADNAATTSAYLYGKDLGIIQYTLFGLLERLGNSASALSKLLPLLNDTPGIEFSCGIILRSSIFDYLIVLSIYKKMIESEKNNLSVEHIEETLSKYCKDFLADGLNQAIKSVKNAENLDLMEKGSLQKMIQNFKRSYPLFINSEQADKSKYVFTNSKILAGDLFEGLAKFEYFKEHSFIYDTYDLYSKYDHFGILYFDVFRMPLNEKINQMNYVIEHLVESNAYLQNMLEIYSKNMDFISEQSEKAALYFIELKENTTIYQK